MGMTAEEKIVHAAAAQHAFISAAESCTGGLISAAIVNVPGASDVFGQGLVTYSNEAKEKLLGVKHETLVKYGAVSHETAREMALGCAMSAGADYAVASTGIAGPGGGTEEKPVGLVYIGCFAKGEVSSIKCNFEGDRQAVRMAAVQRALEYLLSRMNC